MKTKITILAAFFFMMNAGSATVRTLSNDPAGGAQYSTLQAAYNAAVNGDTLLVTGTNIEYLIDVGLNGVFGKSLTVIGIGFNPNKQNPRRTKFRYTNSNCPSCTLFESGAFTLSSASNGSKFYGIEFTIKTGILEGSSLANVTFEDCKFNSFFSFNSRPANNISFKNCIFDRDNASDILIPGTTNLATNILISNCVFDGAIDASVTGHSIVVDHCVFLATTTAPFNFSDCLIKNNVIMNVASLGTGTGNIFLNNISRLGTINNTIPNSGNLSSTDPNFVAYTLGTMYSAAYDFHLQGGSPAIGAGNDATDIGVHGGFTSFSEKGEALIAPIMRNLIIHNTTVAPGGTINVQMNATKPTDN